MRTLLFTIVLCSIGCAATPRPNRPSETKATYTESDGNTTRSTTVEHQGTENETESAPVSAGSEGVTIGKGKSVQFKWSSITSSVPFWIGSLLVVAGVAALILDKHPVVGPFIPNGAGWYAVGAGAGLILLPFLGEGLRDAMPIIVVVGGAIAICYYGYKYKWFVRATSEEAQMERLQKGDADGAAALAYLNTGGDKAAARGVKAVRPAVARTDTLPPSSPGTPSPVLPPTSVS